MCGLVAPHRAKLRLAACPSPNLRAPAAKVAPRARRPPRVPVPARVRVPARAPARGRAPVAASGRPFGALSVALLTGLAIALLAAIGAVLVVQHFEADLPSISDLKGNYNPPQVTRVLARDGTLLSEIFTERRTVVSIATLPPHVKLAVLAAEDAAFYEHEGLNYLGMLRAFIVNLRAGRTRQGGSTITQQVVKNLLLDPERSLRRKIREVILARRLEQDLERRDPRALSEPHLFRARSVRHRRGGPLLFR